MLQRWLTVNVTNLFGLASCDIDIAEAQWSAPLQDVFISLFERHVFHQRLLFMVAVRAGERDGDGVPELPKADAAGEPGQRAGGAPAAAQGGHPAARPH